MSLARRSRPLCPCPSYPSSLKGWPDRGMLLTGAQRLISNGNRKLGKCPHTRNYRRTKPCEPALPPGSASSGHIATRHGLPAHLARNTLQPLLLLRLARHLAVEPMAERLPRLLRVHFASWYTIWMSGLQSSNWRARPAAGSRARALTGPFPRRGPPRAAAARRATRRAGAARGLVRGARGDDAWLRAPPPDLLSYWAQRLYRPGRNVNARRIGDGHAHLLPRQQHWRPRPGQASYARRPH